MKRRIFIGSSLVPLFLPDLALAEHLLVSENAGNLYFDERFSQASDIAQSLVKSSHWQAVQGDITPVWNSALKSKSKQGSVDVAGVTTESFYFCLQRLLQESHHVTLSATRIDRDLYAWTLNAKYKNNNRSMS